MGLLLSEKSRGPHTQSPGSLRAYVSEGHSVTETHTQNSDSLLASVSEGHSVTEPRTSLTYTQHKLPFCLTKVCRKWQVSLTAYK